MFIIFDLPTITKEDLKIYTTFRKNIINDGFIMVQLSVYSRYCRNDSEYHKILRRIKTYVPKNHGSIRVFSVTEKQYSNMVIFSSEKVSDEVLLSVNSLVVVE